MSATNSKRRTRTSDDVKVKRKMSKAQLQLALIKKRQCDAKALKIVEQLLEPNIQEDWLLQSLAHINRSHMEDVMEERAISKLCGYVLCTNPLTVVINQQYHISTRHNKVYDVSKRKNFCSSKCFGAGNYILEQMLTSPLWLRDKEEIPNFKVLPMHCPSAKNAHGDEISFEDKDSSMEVEEEKQDSGEIQDRNVKDKNMTKQKNKKSCIKNNKRKFEDDFNGLEKNLMNSVEKEEVSSIEVRDDRGKECSESESKGCKEMVGSKEAESHEKSQANSETGETRTRKVRFIDEVESLLISEKTEEKSLPALDRLESEFQNLDIKYSETNPEKEEIPKSRTLTDSKQEFSEVTDSSEKDSVPTDYLQVENTPDTQEDNKISVTSAKKNPEKKRRNLKSPKKSICFETLTRNVEESSREWVTDDTLTLLLGGESAKRAILEKLSIERRYTTLCQKLNRLQMEEDKDDKETLAKEELKPLPHYGALQEESKKMELKVRAFFKGKLAIDPEEITKADEDEDDDNSPVLPLTDLHAPKTLRRRIFLDKLNKLLPDLLRALAGSGSFSATYYSYTEERAALIKALVSTFSLSSKNIVFKTAEWTLVGLILIKMLSLLDSELRFLLATKQAGMYTSMILMSYKLDPQYLERLVIGLTNSPKIFETDANMIS